MKSITVMIAGNTSKFIQDNAGSKYDWYKRILSKLDIEIKFQYIFNDNIQYDLSVDDAWIITGSECSVYDDFDWLSDFKSILLDAIKIEKTILGICFGHQVLADVLGGDVQKNRNGWEVGYAPISLTSNGIKSKLFKNFPSIFYGAETHQDIVVKLPEDSLELASNDMGNQAFQYNDNIFGVQFHPEFNINIMDNYIDIRKKNDINILYPKKQDILVTNNIFYNFIKLI